MSEEERQCPVCGVFDCSRQPTLAAHQPAQNHSRGYVTKYGVTTYEHTTPARAAYAEAHPPDPELTLYTQITGRTVSAKFSHAQWLEEYVATGLDIAKERMEAKVTPTQHVDLLDGVTEPPARTSYWRSFSRDDKFWLAYAGLMFTYCV